MRKGVQARHERERRGWNDGFSLKGRWSEWDADVIVTARREAADIPLSFIKEGFLSAFAALVLPFTCSLLCLAAATSMFFPPPRSSLSPFLPFLFSLSCRPHECIPANNVIIISLSFFPPSFFRPLSLTFSSLLFSLAGSSADALRGRFFAASRSPYVTAFFLGH